MERLLRHPVKAKFDVVGHLRPTVGDFKLDLDVRLVTYLLAPFAQSVGQSNMFKRALVQLVRQISQVFRQAGRLLLKPDQFAPQRLVGIWNTAFETTQSNRERCDPLADVVVQFSSNSSALVLLGVDEPAR
jgi:hypothetical protein